MRSVCKRLLLRIRHEKMFSPNGKHDRRPTFKTAFTCMPSPDYDIRVLKCITVVQEFMKFQFRMFTNQFLPTFTEPPLYNPPIQKSRHFSYLNIMPQSDVDLQTVLGT